ncbi:MAG: hypothetical protein IJF87_07770 [Erysipelotrichaceae bacterium]|nr:hypothetical protein [Erysipelotrichaceae bacterium]
MKKLLSVILLILLAACTSETVETMENEVSVVDKTTEEEIISFLAENRDTGNGFAIGTGICSVGNQDSQEICIYPLYEDDRLVTLVIKDDTLRYVTDEALLNVIREDGMYLIVNSGPDVIYVDKETAVLLSGKEDCLEKKETEEMIKRIRLSIGTENPMGKQKKKLTVKKTGDDTAENGRYRNDRIIVSFKEGDVEKMISDYEAFCGGKAQSGPNTSNVYIFVFEPLNDKDLHALLDESRGLDYVSGVSLDQKHETNDISGNKVSE